MFQFLFDKSFPVLTSKNTKTISESFQKSKKVIKNHRQPFFTSLHYNMLKLKITEKSYQFLELKLTVGKRMRKLYSRCKFYPT